MSAIDFVILWVDGADPAWQQEFRAARCAEGTDSSVIRYRDWGTLRYWFRTVEQFASWVRKIHFITWGHLPAWLDTTHPKLHIVHHTDFIPQEWLPTFNSNAIELNLHRIEDLAEHFVLFNDDTFLTRPCREEDLFRGGMPCDMARLSVVRPSSVSSIILNNLALINQQHTRKSLNRHLGKWLAPCYGLSNLLKTLSLLPWSFYPAFYDPHQPQPYRKSDFVRAWKLWGEALSTTCSHPFRSTSDLSHWLIRYDNLCRGSFAPRSLRDCGLIDLSDTMIESATRHIASAKWRMICLHDHEEVADFERSAEKLQAAFEQLVPEKSSYEH
ncbi:MAG: Stealth CR1 domain-containing protein [Alistipes sp.]|nr:Stealth CR1 domain-containing protein [Alistipes sp.]